MTTSTLLIGVDEAGYGPLLGPLCIGASAFRLRGPALAGRRLPAAPDLRRPLAGLIVPPGEARRGAGPLPVPVGDSKHVMRRFGLEGLARGVGALSAALDRAPPADLSDMLFRYSDRLPDDFARRPWYGHLEDAALPRYPWTGPLDERFTTRGVEPVDLRVLPVDAGELNEAFEDVGNKARVLGLFSAAIVTQLLDRHDDRDVVVVMDRHGSRRNYTEYLSTWFPFGSVEWIDTTASEVRYRVEFGGRTIHFHFVTKGDERYLAIGWASMVAKLTRELFMTCLNGWFHERKPELKPTAGYVQDGRRFLDDVADLIQSEAIPREQLVRSR
ncbi:MAG: hypothetical protein GY946_01810 [bacterium]|nr:hypothetical protein [bacterium]